MDTEIIPEQEAPELVESKAVGPDWHKLFLPASIFLAAVLISGTLLYVNRDKLGGSPKGGAQIVPAGEEEKTEVSADDDPVLGRSDAPVTIVEFSDFQCPFCRKFWSDTLPQIKKEYIDTGKAKLVYRDFPLDFHAGAKPAAEGTECAEDQGKFWELHDKIFQEQDKQGQGTIQFTKADVVKWAGQIGLDMAKFNQCLNAGKYKAEVEKDIADGVAAGVSGTPTLFINGKKVVGAQPFAAFKAIIDQEL
jgi:protein-disulfide isomerase